MSDTTTGKLIRGLVVLELASGPSGVNINNKRLSTMDIEAGGKSNPDNAFCNTLRDSVCTLNPTTWRDRSRRDNTDIRLHAFFSKIHFWVGAPPLSPAILI